MIHWTTALEGATPATGRVLSYSLSGSSRRSQQENPPCPQQSSRPAETPCRIRAAVCIFPQEVFKALLAKPRPSGPAPVPPGIFRDQLQFTILASYSDLLATCSQTAKLCNLSWRILCLSRSFVHSASFLGGLLYSRY